MRSAIMHYLRQGAGTADVSSKCKKQQPKEGRGPEDRSPRTAADCLSLAYS